MKRENIATIDHVGEYDEIIDVRSESEFAIDRIPGAASHPVLNDEERARVGTMYVQVSSFEAKKLGAALVALPESPPTLWPQILGICRRRGAARQLARSVLG